MRNAWRHVKNRFALIKEKSCQTFIFVHINKTGGTSVEKALGLRFNHQTVVEKINYMGESFWADKFTFAFVRHPWDRTVSHYHYRVKSNKTGLGDKHLNFKEWVVEVYLKKNREYRNPEKMFMPQRQWLVNHHGEIAVSFVGRFEKLNEDFGKICQEIGRPGISLPHYKASSRRDYREYYDSETIDIVAEVFAEDIEAFGYRFQG